MATQSQWDAAEAAALPALDGLVYRSNLLGRDRSIVNIYGGNTSAKLTETDPLGCPIDVLWVKGSGWDVATITEQGFAGLRLAEVLPVMDRDSLSDEEMVSYLARCVFAPDRPRSSIETLLHASVGARHIDHTHPDVIISLACSANGRELCRELWGERVVWVDYVRPGFPLAKWIADGVRANPRADVVIMGKHGLTVWGDTSRACYEQTIRVIQEAEVFTQDRRRDRRVFASAAVPLSADERRRAWLALLPALSGALSAQRPAILQVDDGEAALAFVNGEDVIAYSQVGAATPDQLIHTRRLPLLIGWQSSEGTDSLAARARQAVADYVAGYNRYFDAYKASGDTMLTPYPRVILVPGLGLVTAGPDAAAADVTHQMYRQTMTVIEGSTALGGYVSLTPEESYYIEYWPLEHYRLSLRPTPRELAGRVAVVMGGGEVAQAITRRLAQDSAHVVILGDADGATQALADTLITQYGARRGLALACDLGDADAVAVAFEGVVEAYGGLDNLVVIGQGGLAAALPAAARLWLAQGLGGSLVLVDDGVESAAWPTRAPDGVRVNRVAAGARARADDIAEAVSFLAGPRASRTTGATLPVRGVAAGRAASA